MFYFGLSSNTVLNLSLLNIEQILILSNF
jgi:hypothetical protein